MKTNSTAVLTATGLIAALLLPLQLIAQGGGTGPPRYTVLDLGTLGGGTFSVATGVNNRGAVAGFSFLSTGGVHPFFWQNGVMTDLGTLGIFAVTGFNGAINERNQITGTYNTGTPDPNGEDFCAFAIGAPGTFNICLPFVWEGDRLVSLPTLGGNNGTAGQVNSRGEIAGAAETLVPDPICSPSGYLQVKAVIWRSVNVKELPPLSGDPDANAIAINDGGDAVGASGCVAGNVHAVLWRKGTPVDLGNLGGVTGNFPFAINNRGQVVGQSDLPGDTIHHAFLWQRGVMTDLGSLPGLPTSLANDINNRGQVVGFSEDANGDEFPASPWIWQNGVMTDLNSLIPSDSPWFIHEALGINDRGQIVGHAINKISGEIHAYLATPVEGSESTTPAAKEQPSVRPKPVLTEEARQMLRRQSGPRLRWPGMRPKG